MPRCPTSSVDLYRAASWQVRCWRPHGQHGMCVPITSTPPTSQERTRSRSSLRYFIFSLVKFSTTSRAYLLIDRLLYEIKRSLYTRRCAFCFERESKPPPNQTCAYPPSITCCTREKHTRAHTRALPPVRSRFRARSITSASLAPRRSFLRAVLEPDHHPGHSRYFELRLRALVMSILCGAAAA